MADEARRLAGKVAIVTGAGSRADGIGNGRATAILLARAGARVTLIDAVADWVGATARMIAEGSDPLVAQRLGDLVDAIDISCGSYEAGEWIVQPGEFRRAIHAYERALDLDPHHVGALVNLGNIQYRLGLIEEACWRMGKL